MAELEFYHKHNNHLAFRISPDTNSIMQSTFTLLCLGCAQDIGSRQDDRKVLGSETAQAVIVAWQSTLTNLEWETEGEELCAESLFLMNVDNEKMCSTISMGWKDTANSLLR